MSSELEREVRRLADRVRILEGKLRQPTRMHNIQSREMDLIERDPSLIKPEELKERHLYEYHDKINGTKGFITRIKNQVVKLEGTIL